MAHAGRTDSLATGNVRDRDIVDTSAWDSQQQIDGKL
jgi:hypothetical protein